MDTCGLPGVCVLISIQRKAGLLTALHDGQTKEELLQAKMTEPFHRKSVHGSRGGRRNFPSWGCVLSQHIGVNLLMDEVLEVLSIVVLNNRLLEMMR